MPRAARREVPGARPLIALAARPRRCRGPAAGSASAPRAPPRLELLQRPRPVLVQQAGEGAVGEQPPARLAGGAVVGLVLGVHDALHGRSTRGAGLSVATVHGHALAEGGDLL